MSAVPYLEVFRALGAEIVLAISALVVLAFDLGWARKSELAARNRAVGIVAVIGLVMSLLPLGLIGGGVYLLYAYSRPGVWSDGRS